ncbi:MAG: hypothetical protein HC915_03815 [Anaerolineae bacterium]|nr:hypothetical protein [Anaerolineae bacterium]
MRYNIKPILVQTTQAARRQALRWLWGFSIRQDPGFFLSYLRQEHHETILRGFNHPEDFAWHKLALPNALSDFGDLLVLFCLSPLNRGLLRQDIDEAHALYALVGALETLLGWKLAAIMAPVRCCWRWLLAPEGK